LATDNSPYETGNSVSL